MENHHPGDADSPDSRIGKQLIKDLKLPECRGKQIALYVA
jgi:hypothetical protein